DMLRPDRGNADERGDPGGERRDADLAGGLEREARMLGTYIERIEAGGPGEARDLDAAHQPHRHGRDPPPPGERVPHRIAPDVADRLRHARLLPLGCLPGHSRAWPFEERRRFARLYRGHPRLAASPWTRRGRPGQPGHDGLWRGGSAGAMLPPAHSNDRT